MTDHKIKGLVFEAFRNAADNGCHFIGWSAGAIAEDMQIYDADLESVPLCLIIPHVSDWQSLGGGTQI